jgi:hypothetical protein
MPFYTHIEFFQKTGKIITVQALNENAQKAEYFLHLGPNSSKPPVFRMHAAKTVV